MTTRQAGAEQLALFGGPQPAPQADPQTVPAQPSGPRTSALWEQEPKRYVARGATETSRQAIAGVPDRALRGTRLAVYRAIRDAGARGLTDEEVTARLGMNPNTARPRRHDLAEMGYVVDSGARRLTHWGNEAAVWVATERATTSATEGTAGDEEGMA